MRTIRITPALLALSLALAGCTDGIVSDGQAARPAAGGELQRGFILRDGAPFAVTYEVREGRALFEGDIDLGAPEKIARTREELLRRQGGGPGPRMGVVVDASSKRWTSGIVGYVIESSVPNPQRILNAFASIEGDVHGIDFQARTNHSSYLIFRRTTDASICGSSPIGREGGGQVILLHDSCGVGTVIHEVGHSLGMWHEQSRCDRDSYVDIVYANIPIGRWEQFDKHCGGADDIGAYDEGSIMHYHDRAFGIEDANGVARVTIQSLRGLNYLMGQRSGLSATDAYTIDVTHPPFAPAGYTVVYPSGVPTVSWTASADAVSYTLYLTEVFEEFISDRGTQTFESMNPVATVTGTSVTHTGYAYTGIDTCATYDSSGGYVSTRYWYDLVANYANGLTSRIARADAKIATC